MQEIRTCAVLSAAACAALVFAQSRTLNLLVRGSCLALVMALGGAAFAGAQARGTAAPPIEWVKGSNGRAGMETTRFQDMPILESVGRFMKSIEQAASRGFETRPVVRFYPSVAAYREATGAPEWLAGSTKGDIIRLQPAELLRAKGLLDPALQQELATVLVDSRGRSDLPSWYRHGVAAWISQARITGAVAKTFAPAALNTALDRRQSEAQYRQSSRRAQEFVEALVRAKGKDVVLGWMEKGVPAGPEKLLAP